jgi:hypothetical protein
MKAKSHFVTVESATKYANKVNLEARGVHYSDKREEAYFTATFSLPRVGEVSATFIADRYIAHHFNGENDRKGHERWTNWRIIRQGEIAGVGPKTADKVREIVHPVIEAWLASEAYKTARQSAIANYVIRTLTDSHYGLSAGKRALEEYRSELSFYDHTRIASAVDHLEAAQKLMRDTE